MTRLLVRQKAQGNVVHPRSHQSHFLVSKHLCLACGARLHTIFYVTKSCGHQELSRTNCATSRPALAHRACVSSSFVQFDVLKAVRFCGCAMFRGVQVAGCWVLLENAHQFAHPHCATTFYRELWPPQECFKNEQKGTLNWIVRDSWG